MTKYKNIHKNKTKIIAECTILDPQNMDEEENI